MMDTGPQTPHRLWVTPSFAKEYLEPEAEACESSCDHTCQGSCTLDQGCPLCSEA